MVRIVLPSGLIVRNYRCFVGEHRVPLRKLTLVFGDNNTGKSALLRTLPLLAASAGGDHPGPLALGSEAAAGGGFDDLKTRLEIPGGDPQDLALGLEWDDPALSWARFDFIRERREIRVRRLAVQTKTTQTFEWIPYKDGPLRFKEEGSTARPEFELPFEGLRPRQHRGQPKATARVVAELDTRLETLAESLIWLSGARVAPARRRPQPGGTPRHFSPDGHDAADFLFLDDDLRARVSRWYEEHLGRELWVREDPPHDFRVALLKSEAGPVLVDLVDCGLGPIQVFPILVALEVARRAESPRLLVLEEPESHLHPSLQRDLAHHFSTFVANTEHRIVIETHSRAFFLGLQLAIVQGQLDPSDVLAVVVRSQGERARSAIDIATFDHEGYPDQKWPPHFFSDDQRLARDVLLARKQAGGS